MEQWFQQRRDLYISCVLKYARLKVIFLHCRGGRIKTGVSRGASLKVPQHDLEYVLISRSNIISLQTHADHLSDQQSKSWNAPACQQGVLMGYTPRQIICQRLLGVLCCPERCWMYLRLCHPLDAAGQLEDTAAPADSEGVCASTLNFPNAFGEVATSHLSRAGKTKIADKIYYRASYTKSLQFSS